VSNEGRASPLEKSRNQIAECETVRDLATDPAKRELFARLGQHYRVLTAEIEKGATDQMPITFLGRKTQEPFPKLDDE